MFVAIYRSIWSAYGVFWAKKCLGTRFWRPQIERSRPEIAFLEKLNIFRDIFWTRKAIEVIVGAIKNWDREVFNFNKGELKGEPKGELGELHFPCWVVHFRKSFHINHVVRSSSSPFSSPYVSGNLTMGMFRKLKASKWNFSRCWLTQVHKTKFFLKMSQLLAYSVEYKLPF